MRLGYFAPLPPIRSGVADYAARMLAEFLRLAALDPQRTVLMQQHGDRDLYHVGNNRLHSEIYQRALSTPGVVLLHDALLHHLLIGTLEEHAYRAEFVYNYGEWSRDLAASLWAGRARAMADPTYFRYPLLRRLAERSLALVVHSEAARDAVLAHHPAARVWVIPHLSLESPENAPDALERERFRREVLGLRSSEFVLGVFGYLRETKRLPSVLTALDALRQRGVPARLLVAGAFASEDYARTLLPRLSASPAVILRGSTPEAEFRSLLSSADVCVNLKHPAVGESSGIAVRAMALGVPLLLSEGPEAASCPPGSHVAIPVGPAEVETLVEVLAWLARDAQARTAIAQTARADCLARRDPAHLCAALWAQLWE